MPPISPAKLGKNGSATAMKEARQPKKILNAGRSQRGHGLFMVLVYLNSRLSNTGIAYIWKELKLLITTNTLVIPISNFDVSCLWKLYKAVNSPSFEAAGICHPIPYLVHLSCQKEIDHRKFLKLPLPSFSDSQMRWNAIKYRCTYQVSISPISHNCEWEQTHCDD